MGGFFCFCWWWFVCFLVGLFGFFFCESCICASYWERFTTCPESLTSCLQFYRVCRHYCRNEIVAINAQTREQQQKQLNQSHKHFTLGDPQKSRSLTTLNRGKEPQKAELTQTSFREIAVVCFLVYWIPNLALFAHLCNIAAHCLKLIPKNER